MNESATTEALQAVLEHRSTVGAYIMMIIGQLLERSLTHDRSKCYEPELSCFAVVGKELKGMTYGSPEYMECLQRLKPALDHHYTTNRHHPEAFPNGISDMTLIDLLEMLADWKAATLRHSDGNLKRSLEVSEKRFNISPELMGILRNTAKDMGWLDA